MFFEQPYSMNLYAIRAKKGINSFDDLLGVTYNDGNHQFTNEYPCTVDPGVPWLLNPMDQGGAAAVVEGQYRGVWQLGKFHNTPALIQIRPILVYRDNDRNTTFEYGAKKTEGNYGIFLHQHFQGTNSAARIDKSSAGCIVPQTLTDWSHLFNVLQKQINAGLGDTFSFTLFSKQ